MLHFQEQWSEAHQERLDLQRARVMEVNRHLSALADSWERGGFPMHMNLAVARQTAGANRINRQQPPPPPRPHQPSSTIHTAAAAAAATNTTISHIETANRLRHQNRQLADDVNQKADRIAALESERQSLIRELVKSQRSKIGPADDLLI